MEADLRTRIVQADIVGERVSWIDRARAGALPAITLSRVFPGRAYTHDGADALKGTRIQADIWATSPAEAETIETALIAALETPPLTSVTIGATKFGPSFLNGSPDFQPETIEGGIRVFRRAPDFTIWNEPA